MNEIFRKRLPHMRILPVPFQGTRKFFIISQGGASLALGWFPLRFQRDFRVFPKYWESNQPKANPPTHQVKPPMDSSTQFQ